MDQEAKNVYKRGYSKSRNYGFGVNEINGGREYVQQIFILLYIPSWISYFEIFYTISKFKTQAENC